MPVATDAVWLSVLPDMSKFGPTLATGAGKQADVVGKSTGGRFGKSMLAGIAVVAGGAALATKALYNIGSTFQEVENTIRVGTGATGKSLDALTDSAKNVGKRVPADFKDVGTAIADVNTRLGLTGKPLEKMSEQFLELSRITGTDVAGNIENVSRVFGDWGVEQGKQAESLDYLFKVSQSTGISIDQLSQKVVQYGAPMRQFGFSFEDSAALMGKWAKEGVNTETIMGGLRAGLGKLSKAGKDPVKAFGDISKAIKGAGSDGEATAIAIETFGQRAGPDLAAAVREGRFELDDLTKSLGDSNETIMSAGKDTRGFSEQWQMFKNEVMVGLEPLASRVFGAITTGMEWIRTKGAPAAKDFIGALKRDLGPVLENIGNFVMDRVVPAFKDLFGFLSDNRETVKVFAIVLGAIGAALAVVTIATAAWSAVLAVNPVTLVVVALAALVTALVMAYRKSDTFREVVDKAWAAIKKAISVAWNGVIKPVLKAFWSYITNVLVPVIKFLWERVVKPVFGFIGKAIKVYWNNIAKPIFKAWWAYFSNVLFPVIKFLWERVVKPVFGFIGKRIKDTWERVIRPVFQALGSFIREKVAPAFKRGVDIIGAAWDRIKSAAAKPVNFVIDTVYNNGIRAGFNKVAEFLGASTRLPHMSSVGGSAPHQTTRAPGGGFGAMGGAGKSAFDAMGGPFSWVKKVGGKAWGWVKDKVTGPANAALAKVGSSPVAQLVGSAGRKLLDFATDWLKDKFDGSAATVGKKGRILPRGAYRIGMPYLGYPGHYGADYPAATGTPVYSMANGVVTRAMSLAGSYGKHVYVDHPNGVQTRYAHLDGYSVNPGQQIRAGQLLGRVGSTGNSTGPHLHFEYRKGGSPVNPAGLGLFDNGGWLKPGMGGVNLTKKPEPVFTDAQWSTLRMATRSSLVGSGRELAGSDVATRLERIENAIREADRNNQHGLDRNGARVAAVIPAAARREVDAYDRDLRMKRGG